jgi:helicase
MDKLSIEDLQIPEKVKAILSENGVSALWPPQIEAIKSGALQGESLVVSATTSSGKTLIAELVIVNQLLKKGGKAIYLVPLRALATQKEEELSKWKKLGLKVVSSTGDYDLADRWLEDYDIIVLTYEKCDSLLRRVTEAKWLRCVNVVVADEIHLLADAQRGATLEVVLTKLKTLNPSLCIVALSATISNPEDLAAWLGAKVVKSDWRPVPLRQGILYEHTVFFEDGQTLSLPKKDEQLITLALDTLEKGGQLLVFVSTRKMTLSVAKRFAGKFTLTQTEKAKLKRLALEIFHIDEATQLTEELAALVSQGVAFHHAGLPFTARTLVEKGFKDRLIKALVATTTLSAGLNLPARRVLIYEVTRFEVGLGRQRIPVIEYHQMAGRAGRPGFDSIGEAIVVARDEFEVEELMEKYIRAKPELLEPTLLDENKLIPHVLSTIASRYASSISELERFFYLTFSGHKSSQNYLQSVIRRCVNFLVQRGFVERKGDLITATIFGKKTSELYLHPVSALLVKQFSTKINDTSSLYTLLHAVCLAPEVVKPRLKKEEEELFESNEHLLTPQEYAETISDLVVDPFEEYLSACKAAKVLEEWCNERTEKWIEQKFDVQPGDLYQMYTSAAWISRAIASLLSTLKAEKHLQNTFSVLSKRLEVGVKEELLPLVALPGIGRVRARALYNMGLKTLEQVAKAPLEELTRIKGVTSTLAQRIKTRAQELAQSTLD